jgi:hypothetical protein
VSGADATATVRSFTLILISLAIWSEAPTMIPTASVS